jgi:hypothetical protein
VGFLETINGWGFALSETLKAQLQAGSIGAIFVVFGTGVLTLHALRLPDDPRGDLIGEPQRVSAASVASRRVLVHRQHARRVAP